MLRVDRIAELFSWPRCWRCSRGRRVPADDPDQRRGPRRAGHRRLIGGGGELAALAPETIAALNRILPAHWSHGNPIDVLGDAGPDRYAQALEVAAKDPNTDGLLVVLTPQAMTDPTQTAEQLEALCQDRGQAGPGQLDGRGRRRGRRGDPPSRRHPDVPLSRHGRPRLQCHVDATADNLRGLYETPTLPADPDDSEPDRVRADALIAAVRAAGRTLLTEAESKQLLGLYGLPTVATHVAADEAGAVAAADRDRLPGRPEAPFRDDHPQDRRRRRATEPGRRRRGAPRLSRDRGLRAQGRRRAFPGRDRPADGPLDGYELIVGSSLDPQFGPVLLFGTGGQLVEVFQDRALGLPPLNTTLARRMMEQTRIYRALQGVRGRRPVDLAGAGAPAGAVQPAGRRAAGIKEIDINPLLASPDRLVALDARVVAARRRTSARTACPGWRFAPIRRDTSRPGR